MRHHRICVSRGALSQHNVSNGNLALQVVITLADCGQRHVRMHRQNPLDFSRIDVEASGQDHILEPVDDEDAAVVLHHRDITCAEPTRGQ